MLRGRHHRHQNDDMLDGCCDPGIDHGPEVSDEDAPYVALFCTLLDPDLQVRDLPALHLKAAEWRNLFGTP